MTRSVGKVQNVEKVWLSKDEAMAYLGCSDKFLVTLRENAQVAFAKYGKMIWYDLRSIERFMNRNKVV